MMDTSEIDKSALLTELEELLSHTANEMGYVKPCISRDDQLTTEMVAHVERYGFLPTNQSFSTDGAQSNHDSTRYYGSRIRPRGGSKLDDELNRYIANEKSRISAASAPQNDGECFSALDQFFLEHIRKSNKFLFGSLSTFSSHQTTMSRRERKRERLDESIPAAVASASTHPTVNAISERYLLDEVSILVVKAIAANTPSALLSTLSYLFAIIDDKDHNTVNSCTLDIEDIISLFVSVELATRLPDGDLSLRSMHSSHAYDAMSDACPSPDGRLSVKESQDDAPDIDSSDCMPDTRYPISLSDSVNKWRAGLNSVLSLSDSLCDFAPFAAEDIWHRIMDCSHSEIDGPNNVVSVRSTIVALLSRLASFSCPRECTTDTFSSPAMPHISTRSENLLGEVGFEELAHCEFLVEHIKGAITKHLRWFDGSNECRGPGDEEIKSWCYHGYFLLWSLASVLSVTKSLLLAIPERMVGDSDCEPWTSCLLRIQVHIQELSGLQLSGVPSGGSFSIAYPSALLNGRLRFANVDDSFSTFSMFCCKAVSASNGNSNGNGEDLWCNLRFSLPFLAHSLRSMSLEVMVALSGVTCSDPGKRLAVVEEALICSDNSIESYCSQYLDGLSFLISLDSHAALDAHRRLSSHTNDPLQADRCYQNRFVQLLCVAVLNSDRVLKEAAPRCYPIVLSVIPESYSRNGSLITAIYRIYLLLLKRCSRWSTASVDAVRGELLLMLQVQYFLRELLCRQLGWDCTVDQQFHPQFCPERCHPALQISEDLATVRHTGPKLWATVFGYPGFEPNSGIFEWAVKIDKCYKGHILLGIATDSATTKKDYYLGMDKNSWGLIGTRSLWHSKSKIASDFGPGFGSESTVWLRYDSMASNLSFRVNNGVWAVAFENIPAVRISPAFSLHEHSDQLSILQYASIRRRDSNRKPVASHKLHATTSMLPELACYDLLNAADAILTQRQLAPPPSSAVDLDSHLFTIFLPSLCGFLLSRSFSGRRKLSVAGRLLPLLVGVAKKLHCAASSIAQSGDPIRDNDLLSGKWVIEGVDSDAVTYEIWKNEVQALSLSPQNRGKGACAAVALRGTCALNKGVGEIRGFQHFQAVRIVETGISSGERFLEGYVSLCGTFLNGRMRVDSTGKAYRVSGRKISSGKHLTHSFLPKVSELVIKAASKLAQVLISEASTVDFSLATTSTEARTRWLSSFSSSSSSSLEGNASGDGEGEVEESSVGGSGTDSSEESNTWQTATLFSNGIRLTQRHCDEIRERLARTFGQSTVLERCPYDHQISDDQVVQFAMEPMTPSPTSPLPFVEEEFLQQLRAGEGDALVLDEYVSAHTNSGSWMKASGSIVVTTRRYVVCALIQNSGCVRVCFAESQDIARSRRSLHQRPSRLVLNLWKAAYKVIENLVRQKQESGSSYQDLCSPILDKAALLDEMEPSNESAAIHNYFEMLDESQLLGERWSQDGLEQQCAKLVSDIVDFFIAPKVCAADLRRKLLDTCAWASIRSFGYRSILLLAEKASGVRTTPIANPRVLASVFSYIHVPSVKPSFSGSNLGLHCLQELHGLSKLLRISLRDSFESLYTLVTDNLSRCIWNKDLCGQAVSLFAWNLTIVPEDHLFLHRQNLFHVLQQVLEEARSTYMRAGNAPVSKRIPRDVDSMILQLWEDHLLTQSKSVVLLALTTVHCLAVQVASAREIRLSFDLRRAHSGPDTLSQSLFDLMYSEFVNAVKSSSIGLLEVGLGEIGLGKDNGEEGIFRVLRLLHLVADSDVCRRLLTSTKWLSLLLSFVGMGSQLLQRSTLRLLRKILCATDPNILTVVITSDSPISDVATWLSVVEDESLYLPRDGTKRAASEIVGYFLRAVALAIPGADLSQNLPLPALPSTLSPLPPHASRPSPPPTTEATTAARRQQQQHQQQQYAIQMSIVSAESLSLLRQLFGIPKWRDIILKEVLHFISLGLIGSSEHRLMEVCSVCFLGGYVEQRRLGGLVILPPWRLLGSNDHLSAKIATASQYCARVVGVSSSSSSMEVVLIEPTVQYSKPDDGPNWKTLRADYDLTISGSLPLRSMRIGVHEVLPSADTQLDPHLLSPELVPCLIGLLRRTFLTWLGGILTDDTADKDIPLIAMFEHVAVLRAVAHCLQNEFLASEFVRSGFEEFQKLVALSVKDSGPCRLGALESWIDKFREMASNLEADSASRSERMDYEDNCSSNSGSSSTSSSSGSNSSSSMLMKSPSSEADHMHSQSRGVEPADIPGANLGIGSAAREAAIAQMMELGLPLEWCDYALRRCRSNIEMAINFCMERGNEMNDLIAQEQLPRARSIRVMSSSGSTIVKREPSNGRMARLSAHRGADSSLIITQLVEMGFPEQWGRRAIEANASTLDSALGWIFSHDEELSLMDSLGSNSVQYSHGEDENEAEGIGEGVSAGEDENASSASVETGAAAVGANALSVVSGQCSIKSDLVCSTIGEGFPSVGCKAYPVTSGKWYYELTVLSGGCVQVGWASTAYTGKADSGQGVGDDIHSWAFDGWRCYLWHETSADWGTRWSAGDVVGCALDMDDRCISYYLNGFGEEVGMGDAFYGDAGPNALERLYPCASFNKNEVIKFNLGSTAFKYPIPEGFRPYIDHVKDVDRNSFVQQASLEEILPEQLSVSSRFFPGSSAVRAPDCAYFGAARQTEIAATAKNVATLARNICILYCQVIVGQCWSSLSQATIAELAIRDPEPSLQSAMRSLCELFRNLSISTGRTATYLSIVHTLPTNTRVPLNLGSAFCAGGSVALQHILPVLSKLLRRSLANGSEFLLGLLLEDIERDIVTASTRTNACRWRASGGLIPIDASSPIGGDPADSSLSLNWAVWLTTLCMDAVAATWTGSALSTVASKTLNRLCGAWKAGIESSSMPLKSLAARILSALLLATKSLGCALTASLVSEFQILRNLTDFHSRHLIKLQGKDLPICSEYTQAMLELRGSLHVALIADHKQETFDEDCSNNVGVDNASWEVSHGRLLSDSDGWRTWSGTLHLGAIAFGQVVHPTKSAERQDCPPELMPGCKVARRKASDKDDGQGHVQMDLPRWLRESAAASPSDSFTRLRMILERGVDASRPTPVSPASIDVTKLGTVVGIASWPGDALPGGARVVKWDEDERVEMVRWGAGGQFDVHHVSYAGGKIVKVYPTPKSWQERLTERNFGLPQKMGIIIRMEPFSAHAELGRRVSALVEWPEFSSIAFAEGVFIEPQCVQLVERRLLSGPAHSGWERLYGRPAWQSGSTFVLRLGGDVTDKLRCKLEGKLEFRVKFPALSEKAFGTVSLQQERLFQFDESNHSSNVVLSYDNSSLAKGSGAGGQGCALGTVGFSKGVHMWELKVEQAEMGSIFMGVCERSDSVRGMRYGRWCGQGIINNRMSFKTTSSEERTQIFGDHFHSGDLVSLILDLNRGVLSYYLDGMKYGEHILTEMGEAHTGLTPSSIKPKTYYPIVGLARAADRVTITPRWLSSLGNSGSGSRGGSGAFSECDLGLYLQSYRLLFSWSQPSTAENGVEKDWLCQEGWKMYKNAADSRCRVLSRCHLFGIQLSLDTSIRACVEASMRLGLPKALFAGDRIAFSKSSGRTLEIKEEGTIRGVYQGLLWYSLESLSATSTSQGLLMRCWSLVESDVDGFRLVRKVPASWLPRQVTETLLPRIPKFKGGYVRILHDGGAVMRNGLEIDSADPICTIPKGSVLLSLEKRINASSIGRYLVCYDGKLGWISERMRGGSEEIMVALVESPSATSTSTTVVTATATTTTTISTVEHEDHNREYVHAVKAFLPSQTSAELSDLLSMPDVSSLQEGWARWSACLSCLNESERKCQTGFSVFADYTGWLDSVSNEGIRTRELDFALIDAIGKRAMTRGVHPVNLAVADIVGIAKALCDEESVIASLQKAVVARAFELLAFNQLLEHTLPYFGLSLPENSLTEEQGRFDIKLKLSILRRSAESGSNADESVSEESSAAAEQSWLWRPPCAARWLHNLRRIILFTTKKTFWDSIVEHTSTPTLLQPDEYDDPRDIKVLQINRIKAALTRLSTLKCDADRLKQSVFGQLFKDLRTWPAANYRRAYVGKGHGGQSRAFKVKLIGEGVNDYGGPYRAIFEQIIDELQCDALAAGGIKPGDRCVLPLLLPSQNRFLAVGSDQEKFVLHSTPAASPLQQELMMFFGKLVGMAVRHRLSLALNFSELVWRPLVQLPLSLASLQSVDLLAAKTVDRVISVGLEVEQQGMYDPEQQLEDWQDLTFACHLSDGSRVSFVPGGQFIPVNMGNWRAFVEMFQQFRLKEGLTMLKCFRDGLSMVLPTELMPLFTAEELEQLVCGEGIIDVDAIRLSTEYEGFDPTDCTVQYFWEVLYEMTNEERVDFLRFAWARSRLPSSKEFSLNFKLQKVPGLSAQQADNHLPHAQTCFFTVALPSYSSKEILRRKLDYAIKHSPNMDADVKLHNAEGWGEM